MVIYVLDHVPQCFSAEDGRVIRAEIEKHMSLGRPVTVSLRGVSDIPSSFANGAFASLLAEYEYGTVVGSLSIIDATKQAADMIRRCMANALKKKQAA